ncbi:MAG: serine--glyoxylate aminotransferase, partial [Mesorhizobium sp.]
KLCAKAPQWHSDTVSAILVPEGIDSGDVVKRAYRTYQTSLGGGLNKVFGKVFRIGHLGWLNEVMVCASLSAAEMALLDCG